MVCVSIDSLVLSLGKADRVAVVTKRRLAFWQFMESLPARQYCVTVRRGFADSQEEIRVRYRSYELPSVPQVPSDILQHQSDFWRRLECVVHAELHRHIVKVPFALRVGRYDLAY